MNMGLVQFVGRLGVKSKFDGKKCSSNLAIEVGSWDLYVVPKSSSNVTLDHKCEAYHMIQDNIKIILLWDQV